MNEQEKNIGIFKILAIIFCGITMGCFITVLWALSINSIGLLMSFGIIGAVSLMAEIMFVMGDYCL